MNSERLAQEARRNAWQLVASPDGREGSLQIHQDAEIRLAALDAGGALDLSLPAARHAWLQTLRGQVQLNHQMLSAGDGAAISEEQLLSVCTAMLLK